MRRLVTPLLVAALACLSSACATTTAAPPDTLTKIKQSGSFTIGYRESSVPFSFVDLEKKPAGYSVDLCKRIAASLQQQLSLPNMQAKFA